MPKELDAHFDYFAVEHSGIQFERMTLDELHDYFVKILQEDQGENLNPKSLKFIFEKAHLDVENPSMYSMVCWMADVNKERSIGFEEFIKQTAFFFS